MLIPIRCFTCNKLLAHKWDEYMAKIQQHYNEVEKSKKAEDHTTGFKLNESSAGQIKEKTFEGRVLDELGFNKYCCRSIVLSTVDLTTKI